LSQQFKNLQKAYNENEEKNIMLFQEVKNFKKAYNEQQDMIKTQKTNIDSLNNMIFKKDITIGTNEKNMKELKEELSFKKRLEEK
jgi:hypothetical protein